MKPTLHAALIAIAALGASQAMSRQTAAIPARPATLMTPRDVLAQKVEKPDFVIPYGPAPSQFGELRLPAAPGPHPVVVLVHGGCWRDQAGADFFGAVADALKARGIASWNIEYRRLPEPGSGWPGTYIDTANAIDFLRVLAPRYNLDLQHVVFVGHSAGGHLAHWAAGRGNISKTSDLYRPNPLRPAGVINLAGRMDMARGIADYEKLCRAPVIHDLLGGNPGAVPTRYRDASPIALLPMKVPQIMIWGEFEEFVPRPFVEHYVSSARRAGEDVQLRIVPGIGHFETASAASSAWPVVRDAIETLLHRPTGH